MCLVENDLLERLPGAVTTAIPEAASKATDGALPGLEELFADPAAQQRVGRLISQAVRRAASKS
jgi:hypothetical protein